MNKQDMLKTQQCVLRVNIHCDGCKHKVKKKLQKIEGVYKVSVDVEQGKVTVSGNVDPATLIEKLEKSGKHAELWGPQKGPVSFMNSQFKDIQIKNNNGTGKDSKDQKKVGFQDPHQAKGSKNVKFMSKDQKSVKFNLPEDDEEDDDDDDFDDGEFEDDEFDEDFGDYHKPPSKVAPVTGHGGHGPQSNKATPKGGHKGNTGANKGGKIGKKGGGIDMFLKVMLGKPVSKKNDNKAGFQKESGKNSGKNGMFKAGEGKTKTSVINGKDTDHNTRAGLKTNDSWGKKFDGGPKLEGKQQHIFHEINANQKGDGARNPSGRLMQMGNFQAVQGLPTGRAMDVGHFQGMGQGDLYNQQYMAHMMMMNQQRGQNGHNTAYHPSAYIRPQPAMSYGPYGPPPVTDQYTHIFSDENTSGCSIM